MFVSKFRNVHTGLCAADNHAGCSMCATNGATIHNYVREAVSNTYLFLHALSFFSF